MSETRDTDLDRLVEAAALAVAYLPAASMKGDHSMPAYRAARHLRNVLQDIDPSSIRRGVRRQLTEDQDLHRVEVIPDTENDT